MEIDMRIRLSPITLAVITNSFLLAAVPAFAADSDTATAPPITPADATSAPANTPTTPVVATKHHHLVQGNYKGVAVKPCHYPLFLRDGFYIGAQLGYDSYRTRITSTYTFPTTVGALPGGTYVANPVINSLGVVGGIFTGYGELWSGFWYTGAEIFLNGSSAAQSLNVVMSGPDLGGSSTAYANMKTDLSWGISIIPGVKYTDSSLIYARLGYSQAKLRGQSTYTLAVSGVGSTYSPYNIKQFVGGMSYGIGIETAVYKDVSLRTEYNHYGYNSFSDPSGTNYAASNSQLMVSLAYHFA
jgi:opacity protein-like surface antigen